MARILIVDDDSDTRTFLELTLKSTAYKTLTAIDGNEALTRYLSDPVDLVITDLYMPERDGLEIIAELRKRYPEVAIIAMSGRTPHLLSAARALGANEILQKPFSSDELLAVVQKVLPKAV